MSTRKDPPHKPSGPTAKAKEIQARNREERRNGERLAFGEDPTSSDVHYAPDELEFMKAVDAYKLKMKRPFPTLREILNIAKALGYRKVPPDGTLP